MYAAADQGRLMLLCDRCYDGYTVQHTAGALESISGWHAWLSLLSDSESAVGTRVQALNGALTPRLLVWMTCQAWAGTFTPSKR